MTITRLKIGDSVHYVESSPNWTDQLHWYGTVSYLEGNDPDPIAHIQWDRSQHRPARFSMPSSAFRVSLFCPFFENDVEA